MPTFARRPTTMNSVVLVDIPQSSEREDCCCIEQDRPEFPLQEEGQSRGAESPKG